MPDENGVEIGLIARQLPQVLEEMAMMRDDIGAMMAILQRLDGTVAELVNEIRATHAGQMHAYS
jgi:pilus assembly protein TadC